VANRAQTEPKYLCWEKVSMSEICPSQTKGMAWTTKISPKTIISTRPGVSGSPSNQDPVPVGSSLFLSRRAVIAPATIETAQKAKKTDAAAARSTSIRSVALPVHVLRSITELAA